MPDQVAGSITPTVENISAEDMLILREGQAQMDNLDVQKATINQFVMNHIIKKYGLKQGDNLDVSTGTITRAGATSVQSPPAQTTESPTTAQS